MAPLKFIARALLVAGVAFGGYLAAAPLGPQEPATQATVERPGDGNQRQSVEPTPAPSSHHPR